MKSITPTPRNERPPLPDFAPVPRKCARHDGWTPARQRAFIEALADTGSVSRAAAMVNMASEGAYALRRHPQAGEFRAAWEAALDCGVARMKDIAFERAIDGYLVPCFVGGRLIGWRRKHNDRLLMFCLRHYGEDSSGKRTTINYFSTRATAGAISGPLPSAGEGSSRSEQAEGTAAAEASTTTVRTVITGGGGTGAPNLDQSAALIESFAAVPLDEPAREAIAAVLADCAARRRAVENTEHDPGQLFLPTAPPPPPRDGILRAPRLPAPGEVEPDAFLEQSLVPLVQPADQFRSSDAELPWQMLDQEEEMKAIEDAVASVRAAKALVPPCAERGDRDAQPVRGTGDPKQ